MSKRGITFICSVMLASFEVGCGTNEPLAVESAESAQSPQANVTAGDANEPSPATILETSRVDSSKRVPTQQTAQLPELMAPSVSRNPIDPKVQPAGAIGQQLVVGTRSSNPPDSDADEAAFRKLVEAYRGGLPEQWSQAEAAIHASGAAALPALLDALAAEDRQTRELASMMVSQILPNLLFTQQVQLEPHLALLGGRLRTALGDESDDVRVNVAVALSMFEAEAANLVPIFLELLNSELPHVRTMSVVALGGMGVPAKIAIPSLERLSQSDPEADIRTATQQALEMLRAN